MAGHEAAASILQTIFGQKQLGAAAPAFQPGQANFNALGIGQNDNFSDILQTILAQSPVNLESLIGRPEERGQELAAQVRAEPAQGTPGFVGPPNVPAGPVEGTEGFVGPANVPSGGQGPFASFFGNLDQNLQSPSKLLGLSLLSQIDPRLAQGGLFAGGLFGPNKLF